MAVMLADRDLTVLKRAHPFERDARGVPVPAVDAPTEQSGPFPGAAAEQPDLTWQLRVDAQSWPVRAGDHITDGTFTWVVFGDPVLNKMPEWVGDDTVDYVAVNGTLEPPQTP